MKEVCLEVSGEEEGAGEVSKVGEGRGGKEVKEGSGGAGEGAGRLRRVRKWGGHWRPGRGLGG
jgi:hypothetical protein